MFGRASASWMPVVPESMTIVSPGFTRAAARSPMRRFSSRCDVRFASYGASAAGPPTTLLSIAPPYARAITPRSDRKRRSLRTVCMLTPNRCASEVTCTLPCWRTSSLI